MGFNFDHSNLSCIFIFKIILSGIEQHQRSDYRNKERVNRLVVRRKAFFESQVIKFVNGKQICLINQQTAINSLYSLLRFHHNHHNPQKRSADDCSEKGVRRRPLFGCARIKSPVPGSGREGCSTSGLFDERQTNR